jgi:hypothetical protein
MLEMATGAVGLCAVDGLEVGSVVGLDWPSGVVGGSALRGGAHADRIRTKPKQTTAPTLNTLFLHRGV